SRIATDSTMTKVSTARSFTVMAERLTRRAVRAMPISGMPRGLPLSATQYAATASAPVRSIWWETSKGFSPGTTYVKRGSVAAGSITHGNRRSTSLADAGIACNGVPINWRPWGGIAVSVLALLIHRKRQATSPRQAVVCNSQCQVECQALRQRLEWTGACLLDRN